jgi:poly-gamma-glutamate capsule biosynthesis protein CapA/YwtB (metallophosphatase superfamily)
MLTKLLLAGDVMTGRGIDQVMPHPAPPELHEPGIRDARIYVRLAEQAHGPVPSPVDPSYIWGEALAAIDRFAPDARIVNLETAITTHGGPWRPKHIHYRMSPANLACLAAARIDVCTLANNHILDWGEDGLSDTLCTLRHAGFATAGAGRNHIEAAAPAILRRPGGGRILVFAFAAGDCGVPPSWEANHHPGINMLPTDNLRLRQTAGRLLATRRPGDLVVASIHWGANRVEHIPDAHRRTARYLVEAGAVDVIHGHSAHHPLGAEVHQGKLILYGCGDLINDYEGITPGRADRLDLVCLHCATLASDGSLHRLDIIPFQLHRFRLRRPGREDREWLRASINRLAIPLRTTLASSGRHQWSLSWPDGSSVNRRS